MVDLPSLNPLLATPDHAPFWSTLGPVILGLGIGAICLVAVIVSVVVLVNYLMKSVQVNVVHMTNIVQSTIEATSKGIREAVVGPDDVPQPPMDPESLPHNPFDSLYVEAAEIEGADPTDQWMDDGTGSRDRIAVVRPGFDPISSMAASSMTPDMSGETFGSEDMG